MANTSTPLTFVRIALRKNANVNMRNDSNADGTHGDPVRSGNVLATKTTGWDLPVSGRERLKVQLR